MESGNLELGVCAAPLLSDGVAVEQWGRGLSDDHFPLPHLPSSTLSHVAKGRRGCQRVSRRERAVQQTNSVISSLSNWYGVSSSCPSRPSVARDGVVEDFLRQCLADKPPPDLEEPGAALCALLGTKASLYEESQLGPAPYQRDSVSLPTSCGDCYLPDVLSGED